VGNLDTCVAITSSFGGRSTVGLFFGIVSGLYLVVSPLIYLVTCELCVHSPCLAVLA